MGPDRMHPRVLREVADVIAEPLFTIFERSCRTGEVPEDWRKVNVTPVFKKGQLRGPRELQARQPHLHPGKGDGAAHHQASGGKKVIRSSQHGFTKGKSCLTNLIAFYDDMTGWVDKGRAGHAVYLDFSKAFDTVCHNILLGKLRKCGLDEWWVRWIENWLNGRTQRVVISSAESSWRPA